MRYLVICFVFIVMSAGCTSLVKVQTEFSKRADLTGLKTYAWLQTDTPPGENVRVDNPEVIGLVRNAVENSLQKKGYTRDETGKPDFLITWFGAIEAKVKRESIDHFYRTFGYGAVASQMSPKKERAVTMEYEEGTILIDVLNPISHEKVWRGSGTDRLLKEMNEDAATSYINGMVGKILKDFPRRTN